MDASKVKRDPDLPLEHESLSPAEMRLLGVRVVEGGVWTSTSSGEAPVLDEPPSAAPALKARASPSLV